MDPTERDPAVAWIERRLAQQALRTPPPEWRAEILAEACAVAKPSAIHPASPTSGAIRNGSVGTVTGGWLGELPRWLAAFKSGWTVAAGAWLLVWAFNAYASLPGADRGIERPPFSDRLLAEQQAFQRGLGDS